MQRFASLVLILSMLAFLVGRVLRLSPWRELGTRVSVASWVTLLLALPVAIPGLISRDPVLMAIYAIGGIGTALYVGLTLRERWRS